MQQSQSSVRDHAETSFTIRPELAEAVLSALEHDRCESGPHGSVIDRLTNAIRAGESIDLAESRSAAEAAHDGQRPIVAGYLLGLIRDKFTLGGFADFREFVALGSLAADVEAATLAPA